MAGAGEAESPRPNFATSPEYGLLASPPSLPVSVAGAGNVIP